MKKAHRNAHRNARYLPRGDARRFARYEKASVDASATAVDIKLMRDQVFFEGPARKRRVSRYWLLLLLSTVIASVGVVSDSTAAVIGAMPYATRSGMMPG